MGRGSSGASSKTNNRNDTKNVSGVRLTAAQERKIEDNAQFEDAKHYGYTRGAKYVEYTDSNGKIKKAETGRESGGGTYKASFSEETAAYAKMSTSELQAELKKQTAISTENYQRFTRQAASKSASLASGFANADVKIKQIQQILRRRKRQGN